MLSIWFAILCHQNFKFLVIYFLLSKYYRIVQNSPLTLSGRVYKHLPNNAEYKDEQKGSIAVAGVLKRRLRWQLLNDPKPIYDVSDREKKKDMSHKHTKSQTQTGLFFSVDQDKERILWNSSRINCAFFTEHFKQKK